jgi:hypothetical protein
MLKRSPIERIIRRLERHPTAVVTFTTLSMRFGKDWMRVRDGDIDISEFRRRGFTHLGSVSGGLAGAAAGAAAGTAFAPGLGTILGAFAGSVVGDEAGTRFGRALVEHAEIRLDWRSPRDGEPPPSTPTARPPGSRSDVQPRRRRSL